MTVQNIPFTLMAETKVPPGKCLLAKDTTRKQIKNTKWHWSKKAIH